MSFLEWDVVEAGGEVGQSYGQVGLQEGIRDWLKSRSASRRTIDPVQGGAEQSLGVGSFGYTMFVLSFLGCLWTLFFDIPSYMRYSLEG